MPAIHVFRRRTILGGDDLQPAAFVSLVVRCLQLTIFLGPVVGQIVYQSQKIGFVNFIWYGPPPPPTTADGGSDDAAAAPSSNEVTDLQCRQSHMFGLLLTLYSLCSALLSLGMVALERKLTRWSSTGSPTQTEPRNAKVAHLLEIKLVPIPVLTCLVWVTGICSTMYARTYYECVPTPPTAFVVGDGGGSGASSNPEGSQHWEEGPAGQHDAGAAQWRHLAYQNTAIVSGSGLWWIAFALLSLTQIVEVVVSAVYLLHLFALPPDENLDPLVGPTTAGAAAASLAPFAAGSATVIVGASAANDGTMMVRGGGNGNGMTGSTTSSTTDPYYSAPNHELAEEMWAERCSKACRCLSVASCFMFGGQELAAGAEFGDVARALADYLETRGVLDVVPSDVATGFLLLQRLQKERIHEARRAMVNELARAHSLVADEGGPETSERAIRVPNVQVAEEGGVDDRARRPTSATTPTDAMTTPTARNGRPSLERHTSGLDGSRLGTSLYRDEIFQPPEFSAMMSSSSSATTSRTFLASLYRLDSRGNVERLTRSIFRRDSPLDMQVLEEGARYAKYALAIYTWVLYLYVHPVTGIPRLLCGPPSCRCCCCRKSVSPLSSLSETSRLASSPASAASSEPCCSHHVRGERLEEDNFWQTHKTALLLTAGLNEDDVVYVQLKSGFHQNPYCILLDHEWQSVVVSIRGTFSLEDCVTDVLIDPEPLDALGLEFGFDGKDQYCHGGVLACVRNVYRDLQRHRLLQQLLLGDDALYPTYTLRLTGHSLGASTCTLLSFMLRPMFPSVRCINYSPPGCSLTWEMSVQCQEWCSSFVLDADLVPRLNRESMERLRDEILELIARIKVPKIEVAQLLVSGQEQQLDDILYHPDQVPDSDYRQQLERFKAIQSERRAARGSVRAVALYPPGKMVHLVKTGERSSCIRGVAKCLTCFTTNAGFEYIPVWINNDDLNEIVIKPTMGADHFPNRIRSMLEQVAKDFGLEAR
jgi:Lipase (class 3)